MTYTAPAIQLPIGDDMTDHTATEATGDAAIVAFELRDREALQVVLTSGLCPPTIANHAARVAELEDGRVVIATSLAVPDAIVARLRDAGVIVDAELPDDARDVSCWAEALRPVRVAVDAVPANLVFVAGDVVGVAAELVRLGCERFEIQVGAPVGMIRAVDAPTYTAMRGMDRDGGVRVYAPDPVGQDAVWTELGFRHPLAQLLAPRDGSLLLVAEDRWLTIGNRDWLPISSVIELSVPGDVVTLAPAAMPPKRRVELRLARGRREPASLWVIRSNAIATIDKLLEHLPEDVVGRLTVAVTAIGTEPVVILRARTSGRQAAPDLALVAEAYAPLAPLTDVYAPAGTIVEPPLHRDRLRGVLGAVPGEVMWLAATSGSAFRVETIADDAFAPLTEWADYVVHAHAPAFEPWMVSSVFELAPFVSDVSAGVPARRRRPAAPDRERKARVRRRPGAPDDEAIVVDTSVVVVAGIDAPLPIDPIAIDRELATLEAAFVALDKPGDDPERLALLDRLGRSYARLGRRRDAGLCLSRVVWEAPAIEMAARMTSWFDAEIASMSVQRDAAIAEALDAPDPQLDAIRLVAIVAAAGGAAGGTIDPHRITRWLDDHDDQLDCRTLWLARLGLARQAGGDPLALAHARDRILARLAAGLPVERELPGFLRFAGRSGGLGAAAGEHLTAALDDLASKIATTKRQRSSVEAPTVYTNAYVAFILAHGYAVLGNHDRARELVAGAQRGLAAAQRDPVHGFLTAAFTARVDQAIAGLPRETPLPDELLARHASLAQAARYTVDRLREASRILEPVDKLDVIGAFKRGSDVRGPELATLRGLTGLAKTAAIEALVARVVGDTSDRDRLLEVILAVLVELPSAQATDMLARVHPLIESIDESRRALRYAEALVVAGHFHRSELVRALLDQLGDALRRIEPGQLHGVLEASLRALRRTGLRGEMAELLRDAEAAIVRTATDSPARDLCARLAFAGGLAFLGTLEAAATTIDGGRRMLATPMTTPDRVAVMRALSQALGHMPLAVATAGIVDLASQLVSITDTYGTNSHYCLSVLHAVESLVGGLASDDLALGDPGRRFIEDDEHLIRRRLFRDLGAVR